MDYSISPLKYASSTMSSGTLSGSCRTRKNRIRTIHLVRQKNGSIQGHPNTQASFLGFSIRGGHEHGTGFFVTHVENGSEAHGQGLKIGDQIIRINGFTVQDAVHKEVLQLISNHSHVFLKVRNVGMIPVKDFSKTNGSLSWQIISDGNFSRSSPQFGDKNRDVHISIMVAPRSKLGCGICKGPDWKPGIFVQFTKEGGIARDAGLRPGDQILVCNKVDFSDISFGEAVNLMKSSRQLDILVRKAAASELFPGESSGYNSSASSVTEDQIPSWPDSKRLSIVKEENSALEDRINKRITSSQNWREWEDELSKNTFYKPTIINFSENGTTIKNNGSGREIVESKTSKLDDVYESIPKTSSETKVAVAVHKSNEEENSDNHSFSSMTSKNSTSSETSSLSSALCMEIQRRAEKKALKSGEPTIEEQVQTKKLLKGVNVNQQFQHVKLMNEFKQAHQKMFKSSGVESNNPELSNIIGKETMDRLIHKAYSKKQLNDSKHMANTKNTGAPPVPPPAPPPPPSITSLKQATTSNTNTLRSKSKAPPVPVKRSTLSLNQPIQCPTPDYETHSISSTLLMMKQDRSSTGFSEAVEMDSLDSFKLNYSHNNVNNTKPPNTYFQKNKLTAQISNNSLKSLKGTEIGRHVPSGCVPKATLGKMYSLGNEKRTADKMDSLNTGKTAEFTQTLNRSNLRKRTESVDDLLGLGHIKMESNGSVRISVNSNLCRELTKSTSDLTEDIGTFKPKNKIMININNKYENASVAGTLKSSYNNLCI